MSDRFLSRNDNRTRDFSAQMSEPGEDHSGFSNDGSAFLRDNGVIPEGEVEADIGGGVYARRLGNGYVSLSTRSLGLTDMLLSKPDRE